MTNSSRKATINDIARLCGASASTVSAALSANWKSRRISEAKMQQIRQVAAEQGYSANLQARGLRLARSGLVGMIIPVHDNRVFSSMSQSFEGFARERDLVPVIASSLRNVAQERRIIETLIAYAVDFLFIAGSADPEGASALCRAAGLRHIFIDLPGPGAPSVVTDNYAGAKALTEQLLSEMQPGQGDAARLYFIGGDRRDHATSRRIEAFCDVLGAAGRPPDPEQILTCGYPARSAQNELAALHARLGGLPAGLFVNSLTAFTGALGHLGGLPPAQLQRMVIGCYDYDPFASYLLFPVHLVRQNVHRLIELSFLLMDDGALEPAIHQVAPELIPPRTVDYGPYGQVG